MLELLSDFKLVLESPDFYFVFAKILAEDFEGIASGIIPFDGFPDSRRVPDPDKSGETVGTEKIAGAGMFSRTS